MTKPIFISGFMHMEQSMTMVRNPILVTEIHTTIAGIRTAMRARLMTMITDTIMTVTSMLTVSATERMRMAITPILMQVMARLPTASPVMWHSARSRAGK
jgi:ABC-type antimicrobial peptide transport system permease subunit